MTEILESYSEHNNFYYYNYQGFSSLNNTLDCYEVDISKLFSLNIKIENFKNFFQKLNISTTNFCLSNHNITMLKVIYIFKFS